MSPFLFPVLLALSYNLKAKFYQFSSGEGTIEYEVLEILPFDSTRKRMSIVLRRPETRQIVVYCKGADSAILPRLAYTRKFISMNDIVQWLIIFAPHREFCREPNYSKDGTSRQSVLEAGPSNAGHGQKST